MANPARVPDPRPNDPLNPVPLSGADPFNNPANTQEPRITNRVETRSGGSGVLIAAVVLVLAVIAYFVFAPTSDETVVPADPAVTTEPAPATPAPDATAPAAPDAMAPAPAPDATAPAAPADPAAPAPDATAPAAPADPAAPAPDAAAPAPAAPAAPAN